VDLEAIERHFWPGTVGQFFQQLGVSIELPESHRRIAREAGFLEA
jgi:hypothetical protein